MAAFVIIVLFPIFLYCWEGRCKDNAADRLLLTCAPERNDSNVQRGHDGKEIGPFTWNLVLCEWKRHHDGNSCLSNKTKHKWGKTSYVLISLLEN